jgi:hypothetical protein
MAPDLAEKGIQIILIQVHEAHSSAWPMGLDSQPEPNKSFADRVARAQEYITYDSPPFPVYVDGWNDAFEQRFRSWPDKYYAINSNHVVKMKSTYGEKDDALIDVDLVVYLDKLLNPTLFDYFVIFFGFLFGWIYW